MRLYDLVYKMLKSAELYKKDLRIWQVLTELMTGFEPVTSSLPRMRSTD